MRHRVSGATLFALVATLMLAMSAMAGGWASATLDTPAEPPGPGQSTLIRFELLQHGVTPVTFGPTSLTIVNQETGQQSTFAARQEGAAGHWEAEVTYPAAGTYSFVVNHDLEITMVGFDPVTIAAAAGAAGASPAPVTGGSLALIAALAFLAVMIAAGGMLAAVAWRRRAAPRSVRA